MLVLLMVSTIGLYAQEKVDSLQMKPKPRPETVAPVFSADRLPLFLLPAPDGRESKEEMAARINRETYLRVTASVNQSLAPLRPPHLSPTQKALLFIGGLFLTNPYKFRPGTVPVMNAGMAPFEHPYSPEVFPQCIGTEFDFASGTYKQVMIKWTDLENSMSRSFSSPYRLDPVPRYRYNNALDYIR